LIPKMFAIFAKFANFASFGLVRRSPVVSS
jgi:hypothetical protein